MLYSLHIYGVESWSEVGRKHRVYLNQNKCIKLLTLRKELRGFVNECYLHVFTAHQRKFMEILIQALHA